MTTKVFVTCPRCSGSGILPAYSHVQGGICFKCRGASEVPVEVTVTPSSMRVGTQLFQAPEVIRMGRRGRIARAAALLETLKTTGADGRTIAELALVLALAEPDVRARGVAAFTLCRVIEDDRKAFAALLDELTKRWGKRKACAASPT